MIYTLDAIFEKGILRLPADIDLPEGRKLRIRIEVPENRIMPDKILQKLNEVYRESPDEQERAYFHKMRGIYRKTLRETW